MDVKPCCHYCEDKTYVRKHGTARSGLMRCRCITCNRTFQVRYIYQGNEVDIRRLIKKLLAEGKSHSNIANQLGINLTVVYRYINGL